MSLTVYRNPCLCFLHAQSGLFSGSFIQLKCHRVWAVGVAWLGRWGWGWLRSKVSRVRRSSWLSRGTVVLNIGNEWVGGEAVERQKGQWPDEHGLASFVLSHCFLPIHSLHLPSPFFRFHFFSVIKKKALTTSKDFEEKDSCSYAISNCHLAVFITSWWNIHSLFTLLLQLLNYSSSSEHCTPRNLLHGLPYDM